MSPYEDPDCKPICLKCPLLRPLAHVKCNPCAAKGRGTSVIFLSGLFTGNLNCLLNERSMHPSYMMLVLAQQRMLSSAWQRPSRSLRITSTDHWSGVTTQIRNRDASCA